MTTKNFVLIIPVFPSGPSVRALLSFIILYLPSFFSFLFSHIQQKDHLQIYVHLLSSGSQTAYVFLLADKRNKS